MKKLLLALSVAGLLVGCGGDDDAEIADPQKVPVVDKWAEWEANPKPYGGLEVLAEIRQAEESGWLTKLVELDLRKSNITDVTPLSGLTNLKRLRLAGNEITDLAPLAGLTKLVELELNDNNITDVTPLAGLTNLKDLNLGGNEITDLTPLAGLTKLWVLGLTHNQITDISPLKELTNLKRLYLGENRIHYDKRVILKKALPNCNIIF